jgi:hypothetical protein
MRATRVAIQGAFEFDRQRRRQQELALGAFVVSITAFVVGFMLGALIF